MDSLIFAINAVAPIVILVAIGYILKRIGFVSQSFAKAANKLVFHVFLPTTLFLNIYNINDTSGIDLVFFGYATISILIIFIVTAILVMPMTKRGDRRGVLLQTSFRSNYTLIGVPLAVFLCGNDGGVIATLLSALVVPYLNVLSVISYSIYQDGKKPSVKKIIIGIIKNPLIQGIALGTVLLAVRMWLSDKGINFALQDIKPLYAVLGYLSDLSTPMALLMLGAQFDFAAVPALRREIILGVAMRSFIVPFVGIGAAYLIFGSQFQGAHYASFIALFATPLGVSSVPMAQEMGADHTLAGQLVAWTALFSVVPLFLAAFLLRMAGIF